MKNISQMIFNEPHFIHQGSLNNIIHALKGRLNLDFSGEKMEGFQLAHGHCGEYRVVHGTAFIPVHGTLIHKGQGINADCGVMNYADIGNMLNTALNDNKVEKIIFDCNSGGGTVAGAFTLADKIFKSRGKKEMVAVIDEAAYSACFLIASACDKIVVSKTSGVGSIGVVSAHYDYSEALEQEGVAVTFVYAGDKKVDANPYEKLKASARADMQERADKFYQMFVAEVAKNRGISAEVVIGTQAGIYIGADAVEIGLADELVDLNEFYQNMKIEHHKPQGGFMSKTTASTEPAEPKAADTTNDPQAAAAAPAEPAATTPAAEPKASAPATEPKASEPASTPTEWVKATDDNKADLKKFMAAFGKAEGAEMFAEGMSYGEAMEKHAENLQQKLDASEAKVAELNKQVEASKADIGGPSLDLGTAPKAEGKGGKSSLKFV